MGMPIIMMIGAKGTGEFWRAPQRSSQIPALTASVTRTEREQARQARIAAADRRSVASTLCKQSFVMSRGSEQESRRENCSIWVRT